MTQFEDIVRIFADECAAKYANLYGGQPEDQLKSPVGELLKAIGPLVNVEVEWRTEVREDDVDGRPDIGVIVSDLLTGHIELKAPGKGARPETFTGADRRQFQRFKALPNLVYTDGSEWSLYRSGVRVGRVRVASDIRDGSAVLIAPALAELHALLVDFAHWQPITPKNAKDLAEFLAPLTAVLRDEVKLALANQVEDVVALAKEWRRVFFASSDDAEFADGYAQTLTYALLLAQVEGAVSLERDDAVRHLRDEHGLLSAALTLVEVEPVRVALRMPIELLQRAIGAIDNEALQFESDDWLYFYEHFLAAYDPKLRKSRGVYYTPPAVVRCQVRLVAELLQTRFGKTLGWADRDVTILDPAAGTGAYPIAVMDHAEASVRGRLGQGAVEEYISDLAGRLFAFEILVGPYAVAHSRITQRLRAAGNSSATAQVLLTDTLESPNAVHEHTDTLLLKAVTDDRKAAQEVKRNKPITVCIGNPPYNRDLSDTGTGSDDRPRRGSWVRYGDPGPHAQKPILDDFVNPVKDAGKGVHLKPMYDDYVYFWRWALWKVFADDDDVGIVSFITASSYLTGPGFAGMRQVMRETFDEMWIIDLGGDARALRSSENVFAIQSPVAIAIGVRGGYREADQPRRAWRTTLGGSEQSKLARLDAIGSFKDVKWEPCIGDISSPFQRERTGVFFDWPRIDDLFPRIQTGAVLYRTWPVGTGHDVLVRRWRRLMEADSDSRRQLFKESRDRKVDRSYPKLFDAGTKSNPLSEATTSDGEPLIERYAFRVLDRHFVIADSRIGDFMRPDLWRSFSERQVFISTRVVDVAGCGQFAVACAAVPDQHFLRGFGGSRGVIPLYRDAAGIEPNVTDGIPDLLDVKPEHLFSYTYGILAQPAYVKWFWDDLELPPPHLPITKDREVFGRVAEHGRKLIYLHTYGERFAGEGDDGSVPQGSARCEVAVSQSEYPNEFGYDEQTETLRVGNGEFRPVSKRVYKYSVSGLQVVKSWLGYRMRDRKGRKSSPLDEIRPETWTFTEELLELLWVLEHTIALEPAGESLLGEVLGSELWKADELPTPTEAERQAPMVAKEASGQMALGE